MPQKAKINFINHCHSGMNLVLMISHRNGFVLCILHTSVAFHYIRLQCKGYTVPRIWLNTHRFLSWTSFPNKYRLLQHTATTCKVYTLSSVTVSGQYKYRTSPFFIFRGPLAMLFITKLNQWG